MAHKNLRFFEELHDEKSSKAVHNFFSVGITCVTVWNSVFCSFKDSIKGPKATALIVNLTRQRLKSFSRKYI